MEGGLERLEAEGEEPVVAAPPRLGVLARVLLGRRPGELVEAPRGLGAGRGDELRTVLAHGAGALLPGAEEGDRPAGRREDEGERQRGGELVAPGPPEEAGHGPDRPRRDRLPGEVTVEVVRERGCARVASRPLLLEAREHDRVEVPPRAQVPGARRDGVHREELGQDLERRGSLEGRLSREDVVERGSERVDVAALVVRLVAARLLGRHVGERADLRAGARDLRRGAAELGDPEVEDVGPRGGVDEDVLGLQVAVDDALLVRVLDGARHVAERLERPVEREPVLPGEPPLEGQPLDELHGYVVLPLDLAGLEDGDDARMAEPRDGLRLSPEALEARRVRRAVVADGLEREEPLQAVVPGAEDDAHAAPADLSEEDEVPEDAAGRAGTLDLGVEAGARRVVGCALEREGHGAVSMLRVGGGRTPASPGHGHHLPGGVGVSPALGGRDAHPTARYLERARVPGVGGLVAGLAAHGLDRGVERELEGAHPVLELGAAFLELAQVLVARAELLLEVGAVLLALLERALRGAEGRLELGARDLGVGPGGERGLPPRRGLGRGRRLAREAAEDHAELEARRDLDGAHAAAAEARPRGVRDPRPEEEVAGREVPLGVLVRDRAEVVEERAEVRVVRREAEEEDPSPADERPEHVSVGADSEPGVAGSRQDARAGPSRLAVEHDEHAAVRGGEAGERGFVGADDARRRTRALREGELEPRVLGERRELGDRQRGERREDVRPRDPWLRVAPLDRVGDHAAPVGLDRRDRSEEVVPRERGAYLALELGACLALDLLDDGPGVRERRRGERGAYDRNEVVLLERPADLRETLAERDR